MTDVLTKDAANFTAYVPTTASNEAKRLLKLYWILDSWLDDIDSVSLQKMHAQVLRSHLDWLAHYYFEKAERNKAKLAVILLNATLYAEQDGLNQAQVELLQAQLIYFQHVNLTNNEVSQCNLRLWDNSIYTVPEMPNWETAVLNH